MKKIEELNPENTTELKGNIKDFWERNVNAEELYGEKVTAHGRGEEAYFADLEEQRYRSHRHLIPWIESMQAGKSVLEIGCGIGMDSFRMARHGLSVTGIDLTDVAVETVRSRFEKNGMEGHFEAGDATQLRFDDNSFDYVYSFGVLHHTQDTEKSITEVYRVLKPGGEARIMLYNRMSLNELVHRIMRVPFEDKNELCPVVRRFSTPEVRAMFNQFNQIEVSRDFVYGEGYGIVFRLTPKFIYRLLSKFFGWHLMIRAIK